MTTLLERAFAEAGKLSPAEQDLLASRMLAELLDEDEIDRTSDEFWKLISDRRKKPTFDRSASEKRLNG